MLIENYGMLAALVGLGCGIVLGLAARLGSFCTLGAIEAALYGGDERRLRLWGIVLGVAILATQVGAGRVDRLRGHLLPRHQLERRGISRRRADLRIWHGHGGQLRVRGAGPLWRG